MCWNPDGTVLRIEISYSLTSLFLRWTHEKIVRKTITIAVRRVSAKKAMRLTTGLRELRSTRCSV